MLQATQPGIITLRQVLFVDSKPDADCNTVRVGGGQCMVRVRARVSARISALLIFLHESAQNALVHTKYPVWGWAQNISRPVLNVAFSSVLNLGPDLQNILRFIIRLS